MPGVFGTVATSFGAVAVVGALGVVPAHADGVEVLHGSGFPSPDTHLTYVGCESFQGPTTEPQLRINRGPGSAPMGTRSYGLVPSGTGTATGAVVRLESMGTGTSVVPVHAADGTTGVSWAWVRAGDAAGHQAWLGRAPLVVPAGRWHPVDAAALTYAWTLVDLLTGEAVQTAPPAHLPGFTAAHGDGAGYVVTGLGCDGNTFNVDALRGGDAGDVTTYDLEGMALTTLVSVSAATVGAGDAVEVTAQVVDAGGRATGDLVILETRAPGGAWAPHGEPVASDPDGVARVTLRPETTAEYRWFRPESEYADGGWSESRTVTVVSRRPSRSGSPEDR